MNALTEKVRKSGLSREGFLRKMASEVEIKEAPSADVTVLIHEIRRVGRNVDQLLARANTFGFIDTDLMRQVLTEAMAAEQRIVDAYTASES